MYNIIAPMYIDIVPNRNSPPAVLLRESWREGKRTRKKTIANISDWPAEKIEALRRVLCDKPLVSLEDVFQAESATPHGHVEAILGTIAKLGLDQMIASKRSRERDLVVAMIAGRLIAPHSKLASTRVWKMTTLSEQLDLGEVDVDELYDALDWLLERKPHIEKKLAARHLVEGGHALYDVSSSYYYGHACQLARRGHNRDKKKDLPIIVYGVMTDANGCPVAAEVYAGNTGDPSTVTDQVEKLRKRFGLNRIVLVGDRGMLTQVQIDHLRQYPQLGWISALRSDAIRSLANAGAIQMTLFDKQNLAEITSDEFPGERLAVCFNPALAQERTRKREELLEATDKLLDKISNAVLRRTNSPLSAAQIGQRVGRVANKYKMNKHYRFTITDGHFSWQRDQHGIEQEKALDGVYVIRTSEMSTELTTDDIVRGYKQLCQVEQVFRTMKGVDIRIRPIRHWTADHVKAHILLCVLAYYVEWNMRRSLAPLLFDDEQLPNDRSQRDPVAPARISASARAKKASRKTDDGLDVHSFETLLKHLGLRSKIRCRNQTLNTSVVQITSPDALQTRAFELLGLCPVNRSSN